MLKLLIADDERIIRETIFNIIDWKKHEDVYKRQLHGGTGQGVKEG